MLISGSFKIVCHIEDYIGFMTGISRSGYITQIFNFDCWKAHSKFNLYYSINYDYKEITWIYTNMFLLIKYKLIIYRTHNWINKQHSSVAQWKDIISEASDFLHLHF